MAAAQELVQFALGTNDEMISKMETAMWTTLQTALPSTIDAKTTDELRREFDQIVRKYVTEAMKVAPGIYARHFTADELRGIVAFYKTPLGERMLTETPKVMADFTTSAMMPMMAPMQSEIQSSLDAILSKHGLAADAPVSPAK